MSEFPAVECDDCAALYGYRTDVCRSCGCEELSERPIDGRSEVYASTVIRVPGEEHRDLAPFEIAIVDVGDEAVRVTGRFEEVADLESGDVVRYVETADGVHTFVQD